MFLQVTDGGASLDGPLIDEVIGGSPIFFGGRHHVVTQQATDQRQAQAIEPGRLVSWQGSVDGEPNAVAARQLRAGPSASGDDFVAPVGVEGTRRPFARPRKGVDSQ